MEIEVLQCQGCGSPLRPDNTQCEYCGSCHIIAATKSPYDLSDGLCKQYVKHLKPKATQDDFASQMAIATLYIRLKLYDLAIGMLNKVVTTNPDEDAVYYYMALAQIKGRRLKVLPMADARSIVRLLDAAIAIDEVPKYLYLRAMLYYDYFHLNALKPPHGDIRSVMADAQNCGALRSEDVKELCSNVIMTDALKSFLE